MESGGDGDDWEFQRIHDDCQYDGGGGDDDDDDYYDFHLDYYCWLMQPAYSSCCSYSAQLLAEYVDFAVVGPCHDYGDRYYDLRRQCYYQCFEGGITGYPRIGWVHYKNPFHAKRKTEPKLQAFDFDLIGDRYAEGLEPEGDADVEDHVAP